MTNTIQLPPSPFLFKQANFDTKILVSTSCSAAQNITCNDDGVNCNGYTADAGRVTDCRHSVLCHHRRVRAHWSVVGSNGQSQLASFSHKPQHTHTQTDPPPPTHTHTQLELRNGGGLRHHHRQWHLPDSSLYPGPQQDAYPVRASPTDGLILCSTIASPPLPFVAYRCVHSHIIHAFAGRPPRRRAAPPCA